MLLHRTQNSETCIVIKLMCCFSLESFFLQHLYFVPVFNILTLCQTLSVCVCLCDGVQSSERPPRQYVVVHGQRVRNDPGLVTGSGQGCWRLTLSFLCAWCQAHPSPFSSSSHVCSSKWLPILSFHVAFLIFVL